MLITRLAALALMILAVAATPPPAVASTPEDGAAYHLRTTEPTLRALLDDGVRTSPTFRALVERLTGSDVVVYVCGWQSRGRADGTLTFASSAGGYRYVVVRIRALRSRRHRLALLAHELQHAVEVAETPSIVDGQSLAREYGRLGYVSRLAADGAIAFDTRAAVETGYRVLAEVDSEQQHDHQRRLRRRGATLALAEVREGGLAP